jgi:hypothetical protein
MGGLIIKRVSTYTRFPGESMGSIFIFELAVRRTKKRRGSPEIRIIERRK